MANLTMCSNKECPLSSTCYRFHAKPNVYSQSYLLEPKKDCEEKNFELFEKIN